MPISFNIYGKEESTNKKADIKDCVFVAASEEPDKAKAHVAANQGVS